MSRRDDDDYGAGGNGRRTRAVVKTASHPAGGGHTTGPGRVPGKPVPPRSATMQRPNFWDRDDPADDDGDDVDYQFQEYPKHLHLWPDEPKRHIQVESRAEEDEAREKFSLVRPDDERKRLLKIGEVKGLKLDGRWALDKLEAAITAAGHDATLDPFK